MQIIKAKESDLDAIIEIENESFKAPFKKSDFLYELNNNPFSYFFVLIENNIVVSYIIFYITFDSSTICKIATKKSKRNMGFAGFLIEFAINLIKNKGCFCITLEVRISNKNAIRLYEKYGFNKVNIKKNYYDDFEDALYMIRGL